MTTSRQDVLTYFRSTYEAEYAELGDEGVAHLLMRGQRWSLTSTLARRGALVFPHVHIADCGPYTAAAVHACLESGADQILAIGVLHTFTDDMDRAKVRVLAAEEGLESEPLRGFYGPGLVNRLDWWQQDHGLYAFTHLLSDACRLKGIKPPRVIARYPFLTGSRPETMPGMDEVTRIAADSAVVSTADHCHHGIGYGHSHEEALYYDESGLSTVRKLIEDGLALLDSGNYRAYIEHCAAVVKSDWRDAGPVVRHLLGPMHSEMLALVPSDFSKSVYQAAAPTWCAGALVTCTPC